MKLSISLPIADRRTSHDFYAALGFEAFGEIASDGLPEPLQFALGDGASLMLIPTGGFGWVIGDNAVAERGTSECLLSVDSDDVDALRRPRACGGRDDRRRARAEAVGLHGDLRRPRRAPLDGRV